MRRVDVVFGYLLKGLDRRAIFEAVAKEHADWKIRTRALDSYIADAKKLIAVAGESDRDYEFAKACERLEDLYRKNVAEENWRDALAVLKEINALRNLHSPIQIDLVDARRKLTELLVEEATRDAEAQTGDRPTS
jgi:hypothetical protein